MPMYIRIKFKTKVARIILSYHVAVITGNLSFHLKVNTNILASIFKTLKKFNT